MKMFVCISLAEGDRILKIKLESSPVK